MNQAGITGFFDRAGRSWSAEAYVNILRKQGYVSARVLTNQGATKVVLGHYRNEKEALKALNTLNNEEEFAGGWVIKINKQI